MKNISSPTKLARLLLATCLALAPAALAVDPPPDGGYPGQNTAEGEDALFSLSTGIGNTGLGFDALFATTVQQQSANAEQEKKIEALTASLKAQAEQIQKVSEQLRTHIPAPRVAANE
jgi:hypothetical protein